MPSAEFTIGHLARRTSCKVPTIRYYEEIGLLPAPARTVGNQRRYDAEHVARLGFIRHSRGLGFSQATIRELLELTDNPDQPCDVVTRIASGHLEHVNERIAQLSALKTELERMIKKCSGGKVSDCRIIDALADPSCEPPSDGH